MANTRKNPIKNSIVISVVILNYNEKDIIGNCIDSVRNSYFPFGRIEVIVVDNASSDGSVEYIYDKYKKCKDVIIIKSSSNIGTRAVNLAIPKINGSYFFFMTPDGILDKKCLFYLYSALISKDKTSFASAPLVYFDNRPDNNIPVLSHSFYDSSFLDMQLIKNNKIVPISCHGAVFLPVSLLKKIGYYFDGDFFLYVEDTDLGLRLRLVGCELLSVPKAIVNHLSSGHTTRKYHSLLRLAYLRERNLLMTYFKICSLKNLILFSSYVFSMRLFMILFDIISLKPRMAFQRLKAVFWFIFHMPLLIRKRKETQSTRLKNDKFVFALSSEYLFWRSLFGWLNKR